MQELEEHEEHLKFI